MSAKTERLLNLTMCLLGARTFLTKEQVRARVTAYRECRTDDAFERMFERDKDELREMGVPLETGNHDPFFGDEVGYRIDRAAYALPQVEFTPDELAVLGLAARAWEHASLSQAAGTALLKLRAGGADPDESVVAGLHPRVGAKEPAFPAVWAAVRDGRPIRFDYRNPADPTPRPRRIEPWGVVCRRGHWYVAGHDRDRAAARVFRLSRIAGQVRRDGPDGSVVVPPGTDINAQLDRMLPPEARQVASVRARPGAALGLRRRAIAVGSADGWDRLEVGFWDAQALAEELCAYGPALIADEPAEVRAAVIARLQAMVP